MNDLKAFAHEIGVVVPDTAGDKWVTWDYLLDLCAAAYWDNRSNPRPVVDRALPAPIPGWKAAAQQWTGCGTPAGARRHRRENEELCEPCLRAKRADDNARKRRKRERAA